MQDDLREMIEDARRMLDNEDDELVNQRFQHYPAACVLSYNFKEVEFDCRYRGGHSLGAFPGKVCTHCSAELFTAQSASDCCANGQLSTLERVPEPPETIMDLYQDRSFVSSIKAYNDALALGTFSVGSYDQRVSGGLRMLSIQGRVYHWGGNLRLNPEQPFPGQIYFNDATSSSQGARMRRDFVRNDRNVDVHKLAVLQETLATHHRYVKSLKHVIELDVEGEFDIKLMKRANPSQPNQEGHARSWNLPQSEEMAGIVVGDFRQEPSDKRVIMLHYRNEDEQQPNSLVREIDYRHFASDPITYPLLFPHGTDGWHTSIYVTSAGNGRKHVTLLMHASYRCQRRQNSFNQLLRSGRLFQQYLIDCYFKIEENNLRWHRTHQRQLRAESYNGLIDMGLNDALDRRAADDVGRRIVLGPAYYGSPRHMQGLFQDAMALVRKLGSPDLFVTFTCNPGWPEIKEALFPGQNYIDRPDVCCKVFDLKLKHLIELIVKKHILGHCVGIVYSIEFQKRGLPHAHILVWLADEDKPRTKAVIDRFVSAEIPDEQVNPTLHARVVKHMLHGPCSDRCLVNGQCEKKFPKAYQDETAVGEDSYPKYRRLAPEKGGRTALKRVGAHDCVTVTNKWVIPYNAGLLLIFDCHINVEIVHGLAVVKYLFKYIYKGVDKVRVGLADRERHDEIENFQSARYLSSSEAAWRIQGNKIHHNSPNVFRLHLHLENEQSVIFDEDQPPEPARLQQGPPSTMLTEFFRLNSPDRFPGETDDHFQRRQQLRSVKYIDFPQYCTWVQKDRKFKLRERGAHNDDDSITSNTVGRIPLIVYSARNKELFYLRQLLHHEVGATSFEHLRGGAETFEERCRQLHLIENVDECNAAMAEAVSVFTTSRRLISFYVMLLNFCRPSQPLELYRQWRQSMIRCLSPSAGSELRHEDEQRLLREIAKRLTREGLRVATYIPVPDPVDEDEGDESPEVAIHRWSEERQDEQRDRVAEQVESLNADQRRVFDSVTNSARQELGEIYCLEASGGTGKTYTINTILLYLRSIGKIALATAVSGIAATLLEDGTTLHSMCLVPLKLQDNSTCNIGRNSEKAELFRKAKLLVIDEVTMGHRHMYEALHRTLKDVRHCEDQPFGGLTILFSGDWKQILPVVPEGKRCDITGAILKASHLWQHVRVLKLEQNMRVGNAGGDLRFEEFLRRVGSEPTEVSHHGNFLIDMPNSYLARNSNVHNFCKGLYRDIKVGIADSEAYCNYLASRAVICPTNPAVDQVNNIVAAMLGNDNERLYYSYDHLDGDSLEVDVPEEYLHSQTPNGFPLHCLRLKLYSCIMLLRNMEPANGHCNGSRYIVTQLNEHTIKAKLLSGPFKGNEILIPRIEVTTSQNSNLEFSRFQFPVRLAYAMTAHKSQGQTFEEIGIYLQTQFFSHGQLYVALSRVGKSDKVKILSEAKLKSAGNWNIEGRLLKNIVYQEVLAD